MGADLTQIEREVLAAVVAEEGATVRALVEETGRPTDAVHAACRSLVAAELLREVPHGYFVLYYPTEKATRACRT